MVTELLPSTALKRIAYLTAQLQVVGLDSLYADDILATIRKLAETCECES